MKALLINPPTSREQIYGNWDLSGVDTYCPPLGLLYIASLLRKHGHVPKVVDVPARKWSLEDTIKCVMQEDPDIVGISAMTINALNANAIAKALKKNSIRAPIVFGGPHITAVPLETMKRFPSFDVGVLGEGEMTFLELTNQIESGKPLDAVQGIVWRNEFGEPVINSPRPFITDLDALPLPAWDLLPNFPEAYPHSALEAKRQPAASIITSRGCPHHCTFCDRAVFGTKVRHHSANYTLEMLRHLKHNYGVKDIMFLDDNFLINRTKLFSICDAMVRDKMDFTWYCISHAEFITEDRVARIRDAGCWIMEVGIESGSERILRLLNRNTPKPEIAAAIKRARTAGIRVKGNFIFGLPTETKATLQESIGFALSTELSLFQQTFLTLWPGCELSVRASEYGETESDWEKLTHYQISFVPNGLSREDLLKASTEAFRRFYLRPRILVETIGTLTSWRSVKAAVKGFITFLKTAFRTK
jgi:anaerobic magnesium-protoporphyrin IX monomethyl ester cyclase